MSGRCVAQIIGWGGRKRRCPRDAVATRNGQPVCRQHQEPAK